MLDIRYNTIKVKNVAIVPYLMYCMSIGCAMPAFHQVSLISYIKFTWPFGQAMISSE